MSSVAEQELRKIAGKLCGMVSLRTDEPPWDEPLRSGPARSHLICFGFLAGGFNRSSGAAGGRS
jgi:hypothetical protein